MGFLDALSDSLLDQFGLAENTIGSLDSKEGKFGKLGDFASKIDQSANRQYLQSGTIRNIRPRASEVIMQEPDVTVIIKKRAFSSLVENYRADLASEQDKLFLRASKRLFYNKCRTIAAYERLSKMERIASEFGFISDFALPLTFNVLDSATEFAGNIGATNNWLFDSRTRSTLETIRKVKALGDPNFVTTWVTDGSIPYATDLGEGTGVIELTLVNSVNVTNSIQMGGGGGSLSVEDPFKFMIITNEDIDRAISEANSIFTQNSFFKVTEFQLQKTVDDLIKRMNTIRMARNAERIRFHVNEQTILFKKVRAIIDGSGQLVEDEEEFKLGEGFVGVRKTPRQQFEIKFKFNAGSFGIDLFSFDNSAVEVDPSSLKGVNGLKEENNELKLFKQIIQNMYLLIGMKTTTQSEIRKFNKQTNYVRRKMRLHYANKPIIQPMDVVTVFVSSKTINDAKVTQGLNLNFQNNSIVNKLNDAIAGIESAFDDIKNAFGGGSDGASWIEIEKNAIAGPEFPLWLWQTMRNDFTRQAAGTCIFSGIVGDASHSYSDGKYNLRVGLKDNTEYFRMGQININPSVKVFNSALYDPLTPFKLEFDASTGFSAGEVPPLLDENIRLLNSGAIRAKLGRYRGSPVDEKLYTRKEIEQIQSDIFGGRIVSSERQVFTDPDGFVYRWKEGIGSLVFVGQAHSTLDLGSFRSETSVNITKDPFAGQDVMNVLSLLITGQPYNFNTFMRAAVKSGKLSRSDLENENETVSFFKGLISDVTKQNATWGNFLPFKKLIINERAYNFLASGELDFTTKNAQLNRKLEERALKFDELTAIMPQFANTPQFYKSQVAGTVDVPRPSPQLTAIQNLSSQLIKLDTEIGQLKNAFSEKVEQKANLQSEEGTLRIFGNDISFDTSFTGSGEGNENQKIVDRIEFRSKINQLTQRRFWKTKANEDPNLFIVNDQYDKNYDLQNFETALSGQMKTFESTYTDVFERIQAVSQVLGLEVFADSQGHINARPPQYNRMPSSVFRDMIQLAAEKGIRLFPRFLESLFFNQASGLSEKIEIIEDQIRIRAAAIGATTDNGAELLIGGDFKFVTKVDELSNTANIGTKDLRELFDQSNPDLQEERASGALNDLLGEALIANSATLSFDITRRTEIVQNESFFKGSNDDINTAINLIGKRLQKKTRIPAPSRRTLLSNDRRISESTIGRSQLDILKITNEIAQFVAERQQMIKLLANSLRNLQEGVSINREESSSAQNILLPQLNRGEDKILPEVLEHMIEDEDVDDLGFRSGQRYVLTDAKIISLEISEKAPPFTIAQVDGKLAGGIVPLTPGLEVGGQGNLQGTAWAVDYDMWRMYGFKAPHPVPMPIFQNPRTQCAPYAVFLLNRARKNIFQGSATVVGNEYIQAGEVYYIEDRDLLFYAESVTHQVGFNQGFTTQLNLTYGHNPGEYIPTELDIIGKGLYANRHLSGVVRNERHGRSDDSTHIGTLIWDSSKIVDGVNLDLRDLVNGQFADVNRKQLSNIMLATTGLLTPTTFGKKLEIEVRTYFNTDPDNLMVKSSNLEEVARSVRDWIGKPQTFSLDKKETILPDNQISDEFIDPSLIKFGPENQGPIDLNKKDDTVNVSPSDAAWNAARSIARNGLTSSSFALLTSQADEAGGTDDDTLSRQDQDLLDLAREALSKQVIDVWVVFTDVEQTTEGAGASGETAENQAAQQEAKELDEAFRKKLQTDLKALAAADPFSEDFIDL